LSGGAGPSENFVLFEVSGSTWGIRSQLLQSVEMAGHVTPVPNAAAFLEGVTLMRGQVIPQINLRVRFGFPRIPMDFRSRMLVVRSKDRTTGMLVDSAREFISIPLEDIQSPDETERPGPGGTRYLEGIATVGSRIVLILNVQAVIEGT
jgi:purine-binding chemotaxis protein CheW